MKDYSYYICPNNVKECILKEISKDKDLLHVKFITKQELLKNVYFDYDYRAIQYIHDKYNCHFDNAKEILDNLYNIKNGTDKLDNLMDIYNDLCDKKLLKFNDLFILGFNNYRVYISGYSKEDIELRNALDRLNIKYEYVDRESIAHKHQVITFKSMEDEVLYVFNSIGSLVEKGVSLNNIYFYSVPSEYELLIKKFSSYYNIPVEGINSSYLYDSPIYKRYLELLNEHGYKNAYELLEEETKYDSCDVLGRLTSILVKLSILNLDRLDLIPILNYVAKNTKLRNTLYKEAIRVCNDHSIISDDDYVFMFGFSLGIYPVINRDIDYLSDIEKGMIGRNTSFILNSISKISLMEFINSTKNLTITFKSKLNKQEFYVSLLKEDLNMDVVEGVNNNVRYSKDYAMFETANYKDMYYKYHMISKYIDEFKNELEYKSFSHLFNGVEKNLDGELVLSYTQINEYYTCAFMYFVKRVLKAQIFEESFELRLGSLCHTILEDSLSRDVTLDDYSNMINDTFPTNKERFFAKLLLPQIRDVLIKLKEFHNNTEYTNIKGEHSFKYKIDDKTSIVGKADKLMIDDKENKALVIDYKTGKDKFELKKVKHGLNLQLPLYSTLLKDEYPNIEVSGLFLQNIMADKRNEEDDSIDGLYQLSGIHTKDLYTFRRIDTLVGTETNDNGKIINTSKFIKGSGLNKNNTVSGGTNPKDFTEALTTAERKVKEANNDIRNSKFDINPKATSLQKDYLPCRYCECFDICFRKLSDVVILKDEEAK